MREKIAGFVALFLFTTSTGIYAGTNMEKSDPKNLEKAAPGMETIVLVGASVGNAWKFPELGNRIGVTSYQFEYKGIFDTFDKSPAIEELVKRDQKPKTVIIKECSVYFPGDLDKYKKTIEGWVNDLENAGIEPVLATTVPFAQPDSITYKAKDLVKKVMGKPRKIDQIAEYNEWLRQYASEKKLKVLDLEAALRVSKDDRHMNPKYDRGDYTHLNKDAYKVLDDVAKDLVEKIK